MKNKNKFFYLIVFFFFSNLIYCTPKFYNTEEGYKGYVEMIYQGTIYEWNPVTLNKGLYNFSFSVGWYPVQKNKLTNSQWSLFWDAYYDQYDIKKNEIYHAIIKETNDRTVLTMTFYDDGNKINWIAFSDFSNWPN